MFDHLLAVAIPLATQSRFFFCIYIFASNAQLLSPLSSCRQSSQPAARGLSKHVFGLRAAHAATPIRWDQDKERGRAARQKLLKRNRPFPVPQQVIPENDLWLLGGIALGALKPK